MRQALRFIPLFKDLTSEDLDSIAALLKHVSYPKGSTIFRQGDIGNAMYLVESGQVIVWDEQAGEALAYLGPGSFAGEIALLLAEPRSASLKVSIDANLYILEKNDFDRLLKKRPAIAIHMTRELGQRLVKTSKQRFKSQIRRISALWGVDNGELVRTLSQHLKKPIAIVPLPNSQPYTPPADVPDVFVLSGKNISLKNLAEQLGVQIEIYSHIIILLPTVSNALARKAISLADTIISIGSPPDWLKASVDALAKNNFSAADTIIGSFGPPPPWRKTHAPPEKIWETTNNPVALNRIARRITGHTVGLALSSGGGKGLAHIGALKVLQEENIPVDILAGTSAGAFFGGIFYAAGWDENRHRSFAAEIQTLNKWSNWDINLPPRAGILKGRKAKDLIAGLVKHKQFEDLELPFYCVAADIMTGKKVVFDSGDLADAIRASLSIPMLANPWQIENRYLIDGAFVDPIPAKLLRSKGADIVIASSVIQALNGSHQNAGNDAVEKMPHFLKIITNIQSMVEEQLVQTQLNEIDVMIHTQAKVDHALDFTRAKSIIAAGEAVARAQIPAIKACLEATHDE
ncbi:MAG TPA: cyclic nucleotide-binding domain-containing protein [Chloroflexi bacterium]|nr:cyclic nucleotide-binding domain-containing protein [Chloroflexota bacterium]